MELRLPDADGLQVCKTIRQLEGPRPLIVAHTGWVAPGTADAAISAGFDFFMVKPVDPGAMLDLLRTACQATSTSS